MTKSELIQKLAERNPHLFLRDVEKIVDTVFDEITAALARGDRVELRGEIDRDLTQVELDVDSVALLAK